MNVVMLAVNRPFFKELEYQSIDRWIQDRFNLADRFAFVYLFALKSHSTSQKEIINNNKQVSK